MRRQQLLIICILMYGFGFTASGQSAELLIYNSSGDVQLKRNQTVIRNFHGEKLIPGDVINLGTGSMTIISRDEKRVTLDKKGSYTYAQVQQMIKKAGASTSVRYFIMVWEAMKNQNTRTNAPGGVVRGDEPSRLPGDSATILSDTILFFFRNPGNQTVTFRLLNQKFKTIITDTLTDSVKTLSLISPDSLPPGKYYWEISNPFAPPVRWHFIIPDTPVRQQLMDTFRAFLADIQGFSSEEKRQLLWAYMQTQKVYLPVMPTLLN
ncbi:MAG TPA: hypothetical protein P5228_04565 [Bacteroidales bacterium]|nr:hypothetical protein [Bacteroidales bacterium]HRZ50030.1 hypothetical protein [Bacteroidales bacterium]